jgi:hypothetical protein
MPVWAAVVIGLGSGLAGSVVAPLLTISHQRETEFRNRILLAAEDFLRQAETVRRFARRPHGSGADEPVELLKNAWDDLVPSVIMIELLFGHESEATQWAQTAGNELGEVIDLLPAIAKSEQAVELAFQKHMNAASRAIDNFARMAETIVRPNRRWNRIAKRRSIVRQLEKQLSSAIKLVATSAREDVRREDAR